LSAADKANSGLEKWGWALVVGLIVYGSLYPFEFRVPLAGRGAVDTLLQSWAATPGRGDFIANLLFYIPFGWLTLRMLPDRMNLALRLVIVTVSGAVLSTIMELAQYFDADRVTSADDVYSNTLGSLLGGLGAASLSRSSGWSLFRKLQSKPIPALLISSWAGYRLYPYIITIDLHKYLAALKPVIYTPIPPLYSLYRNTVVWLTVFSLTSSLIGQNYSMPAAPVIAAAMLLGRLLVIDRVLSAGEVVGAAVAISFWLVMLARSAPRRQAVLVLLLLWSAVLIERLEPFQFNAIARNFGWLPFRSLLSGSIAVAVMAFFEKTFFYGSLLFFVREVSGSRIFAAFAVSGSLLATSWAETYIPGRSAEITDALIASLLAIVFRFLECPHRQE
jgi:VanZ family protein